MLHRQDWHFYSNPAPNQKKLISFDFFGGIIIEYTFC